MAININMTGRFKVDDNGNILTGWHEAKFTTAVEVDPEEGWRVIHKKAVFRSEFLNRVRNEKRKPPYEIGMKVTFIPTLTEMRHPSGAILIIKRMQSKEGGRPDLINISGQRLDALTGRELRTMATMIGKRRQSPAYNRKPNSTYFPEIDRRSNRGETIESICGDIAARDGVSFDAIKRAYYRYKKQK